MNQVSKVSRVVFATLLATAVGCALAGPYPDKPIRILVPFTPGAAADISIRLMQPLLEKRLGQPLVIDYKSGAGGAIAAQEVTRADPDGYTLLLGSTNNFVIDQFVQPRGGFDPLSALVPVVKIVEVPAVLFASKDLQVRNWSELKAKATAPGAGLNFGSPGLGTTPHLSMLLLSRTMGADMTHVPYRGSQPAIQALIANDIQLYLGNYQPLLQFLGQDRVRAIAVVADQRLPALPDVPTAKEAGLPPVLANNWFALAAPKNTPPAVLSRLSEEIFAVLQTPELRSKYVEQGFAVSGVAGQKLRDDLANEAKRWRDLVAKEGLKGKE